MRAIFTAILAIFSMQVYAQVYVSDSLSSERFNITNGVVKGTYPKGSAYIDINSSSQVAIKQTGSDKIIVNYQSAVNYYANGQSSSNVDTVLKRLGAIIGAASNNSVGLNTFQFSDGSGGFFEVNDMIIDEGDTLHMYVGLGAGVASITSGANNTATGLASVAIGGGNQSNGLASVAMGSGNQSNGLASVAMGFDNLSIGAASAAMGSGNVVRPVASLGIGINIEPDMTADTLVPAATDEVFQIGSGFGAGNALSVNRIGVLKHKGAYVNTSYINYTGGDNVTVADNISLFIYNPATTVSGKTITLPDYPIDGQHLTILAGGTVTAGDVITSFTLDGNGATVIGDICPKLTVNEMIELIYIGATDIWYIVSNCK